MWNPSVVCVVIRCPHTLCMCIHVFCTVVFHTTHTNLYASSISCLHALCVHVVLYGWCVSYYTCLSSHRMETLHWWEQPTGVRLKWLWSWWRRGHCWTCRIQYVPTQLYMMYRNMHTLLLYILKLKVINFSQYMYNILVLIHTCTCTWHFDSFSISFPLSPQRGDSAVIIATVQHWSDVLRVLVDAGSDLNVQNEVRYTVTVASAAGVIPSCPY